MTIKPHSADIAIIGMSAMFAKASGLAAFWQNILDGVDAIHEASNDWAMHFHDPNAAAFDRTYTRKGGFLGDRIEFDPMEFGIMPNTTQTGDVDHFLALKVARDALSDAGYGERDFDRENTGVILGRGTMLTRSYSAAAQLVQADQVVDLIKQLQPSLSEELAQEMRVKLKQSLPPFSAETSPSLVPNVIAGRIANRLNLMGPNYIVDGACASSLLSVEAAIAELTSGRCNMVLAGGTQAATPPEIYMLFCTIDALSRSNLRPFDGAANGTLLGEGTGILVLKRLADAERDGDRVYAVIKGVGSSSDGRALGLLAPRKEGQILALQRAYAQTAIDPDSITLIEAHGTGIPLGDKTEMETLARIFGPRVEALPKRALGSIKSMIGHCIPAAGAASLIKMALALHDRVLPPTICDNVNPDLGVERTSIYINNRTRPWIHGAAQPRRAAVNAFGFGGVNAHVILEEYRPKDGAAERQVHGRWPSEILVFAAADRPGLVGKLKQVKELAARQPKLALADLAFTLASADTGSHRLALVCGDLVELAGKLDQAIAALADGQRPRLSPRAGIFYGDSDGQEERGGTAFLFPGEGGQHKEMLADLCLHLPQVRKWFDRLDDALGQHAPILPSQVIYPAPTSLTIQESARLDAALMSLEVASAAVFASNIALFQLLRSMHVGCDAMAGHSTGEFSALVASGIIRNSSDDDYRDGAARFYLTHRQLMETQQIPTGMLLTVGAIDRGLVERLVAESSGRIHIALDNCPNQVVLFGDSGEMDRLASRLKGDGAICMPLPFARGYHTSLVTAAAPALRQMYESFDIGPGGVPVYSCATAEPFPQDIVAIRELATRQQYSRVRFREIVENLYTKGVRTFIEVGPGSNLTGFVRDTLQRRQHLALASNMAGKPSLAQLQQLLARLFVQGADLRLAPLFAHRPVRRVSLDAAAESVPTRKRPPQMLETLNPRMGLDAEFIERVRRQLNAASPAAPVVQTVSLPPVGNGANGHTAPATAAGSKPAGVDPRLAGVRAHFDLMRTFLDSQARVMAQLGAVPSRGDAGAAAPLPNGADRLEFLSEPWMQNETGLMCRRIDDQAADGQGRRSATWARMMALQVLAPREQEYWIGLPENGPRRIEWLLGRIAAKDAVRQWAQGRYGLPLAPTDIEVLPDSLGRPVVASAMLARHGLLPRVSISHSRGTIVAAVAEPETPIGIDFARFEDVRSTDLLKKSFLDRELRLLDRVDATHGATAVLQLWCAKEAASKAGGAGLGGEPRNWVVDGFEPEAGHITVKHADIAYRVRCWQLGSEVLAIC